MSEETIVEGVGSGKLRWPGPTMRAPVAVISRVRLEKYNDKGELYETVVEEADGTTYITIEKP